MNTNTRIENFQDREATGCIYALRSETIQKLIESGSLKLSLLIEVNLVEISAGIFLGEPLVVFYNQRWPRNACASETNCLKQQNIKFDSIITHVQHWTLTPVTPEQINFKVGAARNRFEVGKHFRVTNAGNHISYENDEPAITEEARIDGFYVVSTSETEDYIPVDDIVRTTMFPEGGEKAFCCIKILDLCIRRIGHLNNDHMRAHFISARMRIM